jgi:integrase
LRVCDVLLEDGKLEVRYGWDRVEGRIETKGRKRRNVPIPPLALREILEVEITSERSGNNLLFGTTASSPFVPSSLQRRADKAWKDAGLERLTLHDCRHSYASLMIAAGVNAKALSTYMGHASIQITFDRYGHLMPGNEEEAAGLLDSYLVTVRSP